MTMETLMYLAQLVALLQSYVSNGKQVQSRKCNIKAGAPAAVFDPQVYSEIIKPL